MHRLNENREAPNNWLSKFGGSAWQWDESSEQYYLHLFAKEQADLNWENPQVREEVKKIISLWAEMGVDGFRLDVINLISKQQDFPNDDQGEELAMTNSYYKHLSQYRDVESLIR
ncbi:TPA: alpha-amylase family glycosyl hydrolase [Photobacterium damselae]